MNLCKCHFGRTLFAVCKCRQKRGRVRQKDGAFKYLSCYFSAWNGKVTSHPQPLTTHEPPPLPWQRQHQKLGLINFCLIAKFRVKMLVRLLGGAAAPPPPPPTKRGPAAAYQKLRQSIWFSDLPLVWTTKRRTQSDSVYQQICSAHLPADGQFKF